MNNFKRFVAFATLFAMLFATAVFAQEEEGIVLDETKNYNVLITKMSVLCEDGNNDCEDCSPWVTVCADELYELLDAGVVDFYEEDYPMELYGFIENEVPIEADFSMFNTELSGYTENDELYSRMWEHQMINSENAWEIGALGEGVRVAVIDSGCNYHEELEGRIFARYNYFDGSENVEDDINHGTIVSGIIAANRGNTRGFTGVAPRSELAILKVARYLTDKDGNVVTDANGIKKQELNVSKVAQAIMDAVDNYNCDVINLSLGTPSFSFALKLAVDYAVNSGVTIVAAAGNDGNKSASYPAYYSNVISVGAVDENGVIADYSQKNSMVNICAPGDIVSFIDNRNEYFSGARGTSFASPYVAGACASLISANPSLEPDEIMEIIEDTAQKTGNENKNSAYGKGILDFGAAADEVIEDMGIYVSKVDIEDEDKPVFITNTEYNNKNYTLYYEKPSGEDASVQLTLTKGSSAEVSLAGLGASIDKEVFVVMDAEKPYCITTRATDIETEPANMIKKFNIEVDEDENCDAIIVFTSPVYKSGEKCNITVSINDEIIAVEELLDDIREVSIPVHYHLEHKDHICSTLGDKFEVTLWGENSSRSSQCFASHTGGVDEDGNVEVNEEGAMIRFDELFNQFLGKLFLGWQDQFGNFIDLSKSHDINAHKGDKFTPVYYEFTCEGDDADVKTKGSEIRIKKDDKGKEQKDLRVVSRMKKDFLSQEVIGVTDFDGGENVRYGHLVLPAEEKFMAEGELLEIGKATSMGYVPKAAAAVHTYTQDDQYVEFTVCITGITKGKTQRHYAVRPYVSYTDDNGVERVIYGNQYTTESIDSIGG